jgi:virulence factor Mce-like protein
MSNFAAGIVLIVVVLVATYFGFTKAVPFAHHYTIHAAFQSANNIRKNSPVRIAGVNVGKVTSVHRISGGGQGAIVDMQIGSNGQPIHTDATAAIRPRIFLEGNFFVDLKPGSPSAPTIKDGGMIPVQQTSTPVQLDQVLSLLPTSTRSDLRTLLKELSHGLSGRGGRGFNQSIAYWGPAYKGNAIVSTASLGTAQHDLSNYIASSGAVAQALNSDPRDLASLVTTFNQSVTPLAQQNQALGAAVAELPRTLGVGIPALAALDASFPALRHLVKVLRPAVRSSLPVLTAGVPFAAQARALVSKPELRGLVDQLRNAVPSLTQLNLQSVPLLGQVRYAAQCQNSVILPWSQQTIPDTNFPSAGPVYQEFPKGLVGLGGDSRESDANGIWFRILSSVGNFAAPSGPDQFTLSNFPLAGADPVKPAAKPAFEPTVPCETQVPPNLDAQASGPPAGEVNSANPVGAVGRALYDRSENALINFVRRQLKLDGLSKELSVTTKPLTASLIPHLRQLGTFLGGGK